MECPPTINKQLVSVILPVFEPVQLFLTLAIQSIIDQEHTYIELIIVEEPSPQLGTDTVAAFADPRIRYILNPRRTSLKDQLNTGIAHASGELIARMDADDIAHPSRIRKQVAYLTDHPEVSVVGSNLEIINESGHTIGYRNLPEGNDAIVRDLRLYCSIMHPTVMFRKADVMEINMYQAEAPMEDWDLWCRLFFCNKRFYNLQEPLLRYRMHTQAGKFTKLRPTLLDGIALKKRHFGDRPDMWGLREKARCILEKLLTYLPPRLVFRLFMLHSIKKHL